MERHESGAAHQALAADLHGTMERYTMMPAVQRVAVLAQVLGHVVADVPADVPVEALMAAVARNLQVGNAHAAQTAGALATPAPGPTGLD